MQNVFHNMNALSKSIFKHKKVKLFLAQYIPDFTPAASGCGCAWGAIIHSQWGIQCATNSLLSSPCRNLPSSAISAVPCCAPIYYHRKSFLLLKAISLFHTRAKEGTVVPDSELRRQKQQAAHFLAVASLWPPTDHLIFLSSLTPPSQEPSIYITE